MTYPRVSPLGGTPSTVARSVNHLLGRAADMPISVRSHGALGDGVTDATAAIQKAVDAASESGRALYVPAGTYRTTAPIVCAQGLRVYGEGVTLVNGGSGSLSTPSVGSWFFLDHTGVGFYCKDDDNPNNAKWFTEFTGIGTYRDQPTPAGGWAPTVSAADFYVAHRATLDVFAFNPYIGVQVVSPGVLEITRLRGQPLYTGIQVDFTADVNNWANIHFWPFWSQDADVTAYTIDNAVGVRVTRGDGIKINRIFSWGYFRTILAVDSAGVGSGLAAFSFNDVYCDKAGGGIEIQSDNYAAFGTINGLTVNSDSAVGSSGPGVHIHGTVASKINLLGFNVSRAHEEGLLVEGAAHIVQCQPNKMEFWDRRGFSSYAFRADNGATINLLTEPSFNGSALHYSENSGAKITLPTTYRSGYGPTGYSKRCSIADDGVAVVALPPTTLCALIELVPDNPPGAGVPAGVYWVRGTGSPSAVVRTEVSGVANVDLSTGVCTGTTGTDGNFRISPASDGNLYLENRTGVARLTTVIVKGV